MPIKYVPFIPEPVEGQAVLGNFNRILRYKGADEVSMTLQRGMPLYEMEKQETVGENTDGNMVIRGECVSACAYLKEQGIQVDLVYIDPPFASGADYAKKVYIRRNPKVAAAIAQAEQEVDIDELKAFEEKMYGDVWDKEKYLSWMYENLMAIKSVMSEAASIYLHLDWHIGHYVKILMDEIFGEDHFQAEIVWKRMTPSGFKGKYGIGHSHDVIFWYSVSDECVYNPIMVPYSKEYIEQRFSKVDENERRHQHPGTGCGAAALHHGFHRPGGKPQDFFPGQVGPTAADGAGRGVRSLHAGLRCEGRAHDHQSGRCRACAADFPQIRHRAEGDKHHRPGASGSGVQNPHRQHQMEQQPHRQDSEEREVRGRSGAEKDLHSGLSDPSEEIQRWG